MAASDVAAAHRALQSLQRVAGHFSRLSIHGGQVSARVEAKLFSKPRSKGNLHWASDSGHYRDVWVSPHGSDERKLFRIYFGSWSGMRVEYIWAPLRLALLV
jgi:hypothetical protein